MLAFLLRIALLQMTSSMSAQPGLALSSTNPETPRMAATQPLSASLSWKKHPSYQVFALRAELPAISALDERTIVVSGKERSSFKLDEELRAKEMKAMAEQFRVPATVISAFLKGVGKREHIGAERVAQELRITVIDYRYLNEQWNRYHPPPAQESIKAAALHALEAGDIEKAWEMFVALPRPKAPQGLSIVKTETATKTETAGP